MYVCMKIGRRTSTIPVEKLSVFRIMGDLETFVEENVY